MMKLMLHMSIPLFLDHIFPKRFHLPLLVQHLFNVTITFCTSFESWSSRNLSSVVHHLKNLSNTHGCKNELRSLNFDILDIQKDDIMFELPPISLTTSISPIGQLMDGMDKKNDGYMWCKTMTTNIKNDSNMTFWRYVCVGHLQCQNDVC